MRRAIFGHRYRDDGAMFSCWQHPQGSRAMITSRRQSHIVQRGAVISWIRLLKDEPYPDAHRPQPDADAHGPTTFPHDPPPNGLWFFLGPNPAPAPPLSPPHRATSESGGASTAFMGSRYVDSDEAAIEGATQDASMMMQREHHPRRQSSDPKRCKDIKKKPKRRRDGSSHTRRA